MWAVLCLGLFLGYFVGFEFVLGFLFRSKMAGKGLKKNAQRCEKAKLKIMAKFQRFLPNEAGACGRLEATTNPFIANQATYRMVVLMQHSDKNSPKRRHVASLLFHVFKWTEAD